MRIVVGKRDLKFKFKFKFKFKCQAQASRSRVESQQRGERSEELGVSGEEQMSEDRYQKTGERSERVLKFKCQAQGSSSRVYSQ